MKISIPDKDGKLSQPNRGELQGNIFASWNLDLTSNSGKIRISPQTVVRNDSDTIPTLVYPTKVVRSLARAGVDNLWLLCDKQILRVATPTSTALNFVVDDSTSSPTSILGYKISDMIDWQGYLYVSGSTDIVRLPGTTTWASYYNALAGNPTLTASIPHPLCNGFNNLFLCGDGTGVISIDQTGAFNQSRVTLKSEFEVLWIISSSTEYWIGARNKRGGQGEVFMWDGQSQNFNGNYKIGSEIPLAGIIKDNVCYIINNLGQLMGFNGSGFSEVARLPIANYINKRWQDGTAGNDIFSVNINGMALINNNIHILLNANLNASNCGYINIEEMKSGIWEYTPEHGLVHKYSITKDNASSKIDYGSPITKFTGMLYPYPREYGTFIAGATLYKQDGATAGGGTLDVLVSQDVNDTVAKCGYFITPQIQTQELQENWQRINFNIKELLNSTDKISVKYRIGYKNYANAEGTSGACTWVDSTHLTTTVFTVANSNIAVGDEIEILSGEGSGLSANITAITGTTTLTLTIDQSVTDASGECTIRLSNWKNIGTEIETQGLDYFRLPINEPSTWIQFKVVCLFTGKNEINKLIIKSEPQIRVE